MLLTPHILVGVAIITLVQNPILGLIFVLLSHYFLDLLPHTEYAIKTIRGRQWLQSLPDFSKVFIDIALGLGIAILIAGYSPLVLIAAFFAIFPDGLTLLHCIFPINGLLKKHVKIHVAINAIDENKKIPVFWGIVTQIIISIIAVFLLL